MRNVAWLSRRDDAIINLKNYRASSFGFLAKCRSKIPPQVEAYNANPLQLECQSHLEMHVTSWDSSDCVANPVIPSIASVNKSSLYIRTSEPLRERPCVLEDLHSKAGRRMPCKVTMQQLCSGIVERILENSETVSTKLGLWILQSSRLVGSKSFSSAANLSVQALQSSAKFGKIPSNPQWIKDMMFPQGTCVFKVDCEPWKTDMERIDLYADIAHRRD